MATVSPDSSLTVATVVDDVLPRLGLAYVSDAQGHTWGLTRLAEGIGLDRLEPGQRLSITLRRHDDFTIASAYAPLDD